MSDIKKKKILLGILFVSVVILAAGIILFAGVRTNKQGVTYPKDRGKETAGIVLMIIGSVCTFGGMIAFLVHTRKSQAGRGRNAQWTADQVRKIRKREIIATVIAAILAGGLLAAWFHPVSLALAVCLVTGAAGSLIRLYLGKDALTCVSAALGFFTTMALIFIFGRGLQKKPATERYTYYINGVKVGEGDNSSSNTTALWLGGILLCSFLIWIIAVAVHALCAGKEKPGLPDHA